MNKGIINEQLLEKDIEQIYISVNLENKNLIDICTKMEESSNGYRSSNTNLLLESIQNFKNNIDKIHSKRLKYIAVLNRVIAQYNMLSTNTKQTFSEDN